jgi:hypothetical protein
LRREQLTPEEIEDLGMVSEGEARVRAAGHWLVTYLGRGWHFSADVKAAAAANGFPARVVEEAANREGVVFARTPTVPSRTLWGNGDEALAWLEEQEAVPESSQVDTPGPSEEPS